MKNGGICGMPTDTVYVLVAACNRPDAVVKAYKWVSFLTHVLAFIYCFHILTIVTVPSRVKKQAQDRPMSMWISSIKQLEPVRHLLSPLLLDFMEAAWPSSISMVIPRGRCKILGMSHACWGFHEHHTVFLVSCRTLDGHLWFGRCCQTHRDSTKHCHQKSRLCCSHTSHQSGMEHEY